MSPARFEHLVRLALDEYREQLPGMRNNRQWQFLALELIRKVEDICNDTSNNHPQQ